MSIFVSTTYFGDQSNINDALKELEGVGIKNVELGSNHKSLNINELNLRTDTTYIIHNYFPPRENDFVLNIASEDANTRKKSIDFIKDTINICKKLKIKYHTIHPGFFAEAVSPHRNGGRNRNFDFVFQPSASNRQKVLERTTKIIKTLLLFAQENGVQLLIENQGSRTSKDFTLFDSVKELDTLEDDVGETLKFNFNLAHATLAGFNLMDESTFKHFYDNSLFFECSEIEDNHDSHLPILPPGGFIKSLLEKYADSFAKSDIILEYRNIGMNQMKKSYDYVSLLLNSTAPII